MRTAPLDRLTREKIWLDDSRRRGSGAHPISEQLPRIGFWAVSPR